MASKPSQTLQTLSREMSPSEFSKLLEKQVYPLLDTLPAAKHARLLEALEERTRKSVVDYRAKEKALLKKVRALEKHIDDDWKNGYEEQGEMMDKIAGEIYDWLQKLWIWGVEQGNEVMLVHESLKVCLRVVDKLFDTNSREEFEEHDWDFKLKDSVGNIIYTQEYEDQARIILWAWRELLVSSLAQGKSTNVEQMIKDLLEIGHAKDIVELLTEGDENGMAVDEHKLHDEHWSDGMRAAALQLKKMLKKRKRAIDDAEDNKKKRRRRLRYLR